MKNIYIIVSGLILVGAGVFFASNMSPNAPLAVPNENIAYAQEYKDYSPELLETEQAKGKNVAVFYHSSSCGTCRGLDKSIKEEIAKIPSDLVVLKADRDQYQSEAKTHGVTSYHTVRYYDQGEPRNQAGVYSLDDLLSYAQL